ncbi:hypothetical protein DFJ74DRAFT_709360 [Hyaloraphidium curvatum]|nr:hypothetical protein DFJ74DRAFT_709360 [Hyaloraphidium curvatum]
MRSTDRPRVDNLPDLPFLPGFGQRLDDVPRKKIHTMDIVNGFPLPNEVIDPASPIARIVADTRAAAPEAPPTATEEAYEEEKRNEEERIHAAVDAFRSRASDAVRPFVPDYVLKDKVVLTFAGYFVEEVAAQTESEKLTTTSLTRRVVINFFVEDGTISVVEPARGLLVSRQVIPKERQDKTKGVYGARDFDCGKDVVFYGRKYTVAEADEFTKNYFKTNLKPLSPSVALPDDTLAPKKQSTPVRAPESPTCADGPHNDKLGRFLLFDRTVLRFFGVWLGEDGVAGSAEGRSNVIAGPVGSRECILQFYLVDDTCEVREVRKKNDGYSGSDISAKLPLLLRRGPLPKIFNRLNDLNEAPRYTWRDMGIGVVIDVLHRKLLIRDCDDFTRTFLRENLGRREDELQPLQMDLPPAPKHEHILPPYNGFGSEEDSAESCRRLVLKAHQKDLNKLLAFHNVSLRFLARIAEPGEARDDARRFVVTFYLADDTISISEPAQKVFTIGAKRLERTKILKPGFRLGDLVADKYYTARDLDIGASLECFGFTYELLDADDFVFEWMQKDGRLDIEGTAAVIRQHMRSLPGNDRTQIERELKSMDRQKLWTVPRDDMFRFLRRTLGSFVTDTQIYAVVGRFRKPGAPNMIQYVKFLEAFVYQAASAQ